MENWIYQTNSEDTARFVIGTEGKNPLIVMSINPSIGSPEKSTPTIGTVRHIAADYGYDSWIILCLYPQRATHLDELNHLANPAWIAQNNQVIDEILAKFPNHKIWAAWGTHFFDRYFFKQCLDDIVQIANKYGETWMHYGSLDEDGAPRYCLYLEDGEGFFDYDVKNFLENS